MKGVPASKKVGNLCSRVRLLKAAATMDENMS